VDDKIILTGEQAVMIAAALQVGMDGLDGDEYEVAASLAAVLDQHVADNVGRVLIIPACELHVR
jgi:hypothetical protein